MIRYQLNCENDHAFDGWFAGSQAFETQLERGLVTCPVCGSSKVRKAIMAPNVSSSTRRKGDEPVTKPAPSDASAGAASPAPQSAPTVAGEVLPPGSDASVPMATGPQPEQVAKLVAFMREVRRTVEANAEHVGNKFADEARKMHYGEADERAIYGEATLEDAAELVDEGIAVQPLPILPEDRN